MARRGRFGRRPRSSPDLTSTIVAMAREYQNKMDQNVLNSWDKGGKVDGRQVTDEYLLDYLGKRRDGLAKDDPLYDEMNQRVDEYTFAVANSKQELGYAEGKHTDRDMSAFYRKWGAKLPTNSEAWRKMMTLAAQYKDRAAKSGGGGGRGGGGGGGKPAYDSATNRSPQKKEFAYDTMFDALNFIAHREGILNTQDEKLTDLRAAEGDASRLVQLINVLSTDPAYAGYRQNLTDVIRKYGNPNFSGAFTWETFQAEQVNKRSGLTSRLRNAQTAGHKTDSKALTGELTDNGETFTALTAAKPLEKYENARHIYDTLTDDPNASPIDLYVALTGYRDALTKIHGEVATMAGASGDIGAATMQGHLKNELDSLYGADINAPTLWEDSRGTVAAYHQEGGETKANKQDYDHLIKQVGLLASGQGVVVRVDTSGQPTTDPDGAYDVVPVAALPPTVAWAPTGGGNATKSIDFEGKTIDVSGVMTAILPTPIYTAASGPADYTGRLTASPATAKSNTNIANMFVMPDGTRLAQYWDSTGTRRWTNDPDSLFVGPNGPIVPEQTPDGLRITIPAQKGRPTYDPTSAIDPMYTNPLTADSMVNKVGLSSYSVWLNSTRTDKNDPGVAYAMDPSVMAAAITREVGVQDPAKLGAALREAETARTDYLQKTPDIDRRIRAAAEQQRTGTIADKAGVEGYADFGGVQRDVLDYYDRLRAQSAGGGLGGEAGSTTAGRTGANADRDAIIRRALEADPTERFRIAAIENGDNMLPSHIKDLMSQQSKDLVAPVVFRTGKEQDDIVANFKALTATQLSGVAGALAAAPSFAPPAGGGGPGGRTAPPPPTPPPPKAPPPPTPPKPTPAPAPTPSYAAGGGGPGGRDAPAYTPPPPATHPPGYGPWSSGY